MARWRRVLAWAAGAGVVLGSPVIGDLRLALLRAFPRQYVAIISAGVVVGGVVVLGVCLRAIRSERPRRIGILGLGLALAVGSFAALRSGNPNVDAVEAFHFVEYGVLALLFFPFGQRRARWEAYVGAALATTAVGVADEWFQWFVPGRAGEWHDVMFDLLATACGLLMCLALDTRQSYRSGQRTRLGLGSAAVVLLLGAFIASIHLGTEIRDPEIGRFRSRFSEARLRELGVERLREWNGGPPPVVGRYGREDQYEAEALWHVRRRNFGMDLDRKGDAAELDIAWHENLILERHFKAVLDAASAGGAVGHRLAPEQVADVDARRAHGTAPFVSDAEAMPIYLWSPAAFWAVVAAVALAAIGFFPALRRF
ncbi:MAG TPA: VanZ family protein [Vicinamibacterales bacterium]|nr:VanZ family protein [Vicinamibacterales bacterium]